MPHFQRIINICLLFILSLCSFSCANNLTLGEFDLGGGRIIKVTTGVPDPLLPIYYETYKIGSLINKTVVLFESSDYQDVKKLKFKLTGDKSENIFALTQEAPEKGTLAIFDFATGFRCPGSDIDQHIEVKRTYNRLAEILERDNPGVTIRRAKLP